MTCTTQDLTSLRWYFDGLQRVTYTLSRAATLPENIYDEGDISIAVTLATSRLDDIDEFNGTSVLTTTTLALSMLDADNITCGTNSEMSDIIDITMLNVQGKCM